MNQDGGISSFKGKIVAADEVVQASDGHKYWKLTQQYEEAKQQGELQSSAAEIDPNSGSYLFAAIFVAFEKSQTTRSKGTITKTRLHEMAQERGSRLDKLVEGLAPNAPDVLDVHAFAAHMLVDADGQAVRDRRQIEEAMASSERGEMMSAIFRQFQLEIPSDEEMLDALKTREETDLMEGLKSGGTVNAEGHSHLLCRWEVCPHC